MMATTLRYGTPDYWRERCLAAENALRRARTALVMTPQRRQALAVLGDLRAGQCLNTNEVAERLQLSAHNAFYQLAAMQAVGLVDLVERGTKGRPAQWRLAHLVATEEPEGQPA